MTGRGPEAFKPGDVVAGRYELLRPIGRGAMGFVWAARHSGLGREFALKFPKLSRKMDHEARERFLLEARLAAKLRHPNVVEVADVDRVEGGGLYLVMELLRGQTLADYVATNGRLEARFALQIARGVASGLAAAHEAGIVHRDVKPENIFLEQADPKDEDSLVPKLLDFGISKADVAAGLTVDGRMLGTPAYMSPEQALGETDIDPRTDIWSLGVVMYEMIVGVVPFTAASYQALLPKIAESPHPALPPRVPEAVRRVVDACLAKAREERPQTAAELVARLDAALDEVPESNDRAWKVVQRLIARGGGSAGATATAAKPDLEPLVAALEAGRAHLFDPLPPPSERAPARRAERRPERSEAGPGREAGEARQTEGFDGEASLRTSILSTRPSSPARGPTRGSARGRSRFWIGAAIGAGALTLFGWTSIERAEHAGAREAAAIGQVPSPPSEPPPTRAAHAEPDALPLGPAAHASAPRRLPPRSETVGAHFEGADLDRPRRRASVPPLGRATAPEPRVEPPPALAAAARPDSEPVDPGDPADPPREPEAGEPPPSAVP